MSLRKHGGLAGAIYLNAPATVVDSNDLAPHAADELARLVELVRSLKERAEDSSVAGADQMSYTISIEDDKGCASLHQYHSNMAPAFRALKDWLEAHK
ncbi:MAG: protealysin inhibitor emfourin [Methylocystis sp.]